MRLGASLGAVGKENISEVSSLSDAYAQLAGLLGGNQADGQALGGWLPGQVEQAGQGRLQVICGGLTLDQDDLKVLSGLSYTWVVDTGGEELLRRGDRVVVLVTADRQDYYVLVKLA